MKEEQDLPYIDKKEILSAELRRLSLLRSRSENEKKSPKNLKKNRKRNCF
jgi:hypothetical protein